MIYDQFLQYESSSDSQLYAHCPFHDDSTPSLTVNKDTSEWYCHGCNKGGVEKEFVGWYYDIPMDVAKYAVDFWDKKGKWPFPTEEQVDAWHRDLLKKPKELEVLRSFGFTDKVIKELKVGLEDLRITIPIRSRRGHIINIRKYLPPHHRTEKGTNPKCISVKGLGAKRYFPYTAFDEQVIYVVEGEKDCIAARSQGYNAVTSTGGSTIPTEEVGLFRGKDVYLMLDSDAVGKRNTANYVSMLRPMAKSIHIVELPTKDYVDYYQLTGKSDVSDFVKEVEDAQPAQGGGEAQEVSLVRSEFTEHLNLWVKLNNMSVVGVEPKVYTVPTKLRASCRNAKCNRPCALMIGGDEVAVVSIEPRQMLQFVDSSDSAQESYLRKIFGCKTVGSEPLEFINVQKIIFQESASFIDGLEESSFEHRYGIYMYTDYRLSATLKYNFEACRVTDPRSQQNYYVIRSAENVGAITPVIAPEHLQHFQRVASQSHTAAELLNRHYAEWMGALAIEGRPDLFGAVLLTYCSVTEIPWAAGIIKGWLDTMVIGDTRTGKSQMAQRFVKTLGMGGYINGENARRTGVIGGVQRFGESWVVTWGAIPMNDRGLLIIDEASGLDVDDVKDLSSTRSSGAVTMNKIVRGEARARTRLLWLSNPRSGKNLSDFYWKGYGAFQEFIPVAEDQARFDLVLTAAREDIDVLEGIEDETKPDVDAWHSLFAMAWSVSSGNIRMRKDMKPKVREAAHRLNDAFGGGPLVVGVAVHEKLLRLACAFAVLSGSFLDNTLIVDETHLQYAEELLSTTLNKPSFGYGDYIREFKRAQNKRSDNVEYVRALVTLHPALKILLSSSSFKGYQFQEILGIDRVESSKIMSDLITRGLLRPTSGATYVPDKMLMEIAKQMEV